MEQPAGLKVKLLDLAGKLSDLVHGEYEPVEDPECPDLSELMIWSNGYQDPMLRYADLYRWTGNRQLLAHLTGAASEAELLTGPLTSSPVDPAAPETAIHPAAFSLRMNRFPRLPVHYLYPTGMTFRPLILYTLHRIVDRLEESG